MKDEKISTIELLNLNEKLKQTQNDDTPYAAIEDKQISVLGDANKTKVKKADYVIKFRIPQAVLEEKPKAAKCVGNYYIVEMKYEDISLNPRNDLKVMAAITEMLPFFNELKENGEMESISGEELMKRLAYASGDFIPGMYHLVATFLEIGDELKNYMMGASVMIALNQIIDTHPEVFNEADIFFA